MTLQDFVESDDRAPVLHKDEEFSVRVPGKGVVTAYRGPIPARRAYGALQFRRRDEHYHHNERGYALSERMLRKIRTFGCQLILIAEIDTDAVFEFHENQFTEQVSKKNNPNHDEDPQRKVLLEENWNKHAEHARDVLFGERGTN